MSARKYGRKWQNKQGARNYEGLHILGPVWSKMLEITREFLEWPGRQRQSGVQGGIIRDVIGPLCKRKLSFPRLVSSFPFHHETQALAWRHGRKSRGMASYLSQSVSQDFNTVSTAVPKLLCRGKKNCASSKIVLFWPSWMDYLNSTTICTIWTASTTNWNV